MAIERRNPLPPGRYWVDIFDTDEPFGGGPLGFNIWLMQNSSSVTLLKREQTSSRLATGVAGWWYLFDVTRPVIWPRNKRFGLPTIVSPAATPTAQDTVQRPPPTTMSDEISRVVEPLRDAAIVALLVLIGAAMWRR